MKGRAAIGEDWPKGGGVPSRLARLTDGAGGDFQGGGGEETGASFNSPLSRTGPSAVCCWGFGLSPVLCRCGSPASGLAAGGADCAVWVFCGSTSGAARAGADGSSWGAAAGGAARAVDAGGVAWAVDGVSTDWFVPVCGLVEGSFR